jgi:hypothetical protein
MKTITIPKVLLAIAVAGRFEPDGTLVVETTRFSPVRWGNHPAVDSSEKKRIVERYKLIDSDMGDEPELHAGGSGVLHGAGECERHIYEVL